jgi:hypothetical protein
MKTFYKILLSTRTNKYRIMVYTPVSRNTVVRYIHTWEDKHEQLYNMQWLQTTNNPLSILQYDTEEAAKVVVEDVQTIYNIDSYVEVSCSEAHNDSDTPDV